MIANTSETASAKAPKITLDSNPSDAPCCVKVVHDDGRDLLFQTDWDWPSVARNFGFSLSSVQRCDKCGKVSTGLSNKVVKYCKHCGQNVGHVCHHESTDGTVDCEACGVTASAFIAAARQWLDDHDGEQAEDPGYFE